MCMGRTCSQWLTNSRKTVYMRHHRFLPKKHPYKFMKSQFNGKEELFGKPKILRGTTLFKMVQKVKVVLGKVPKPKKDPKLKKNPKSKQALFYQRNGVFLIGW